LSFKFYKKQKIESLYPEIKVTSCLLFMLFLNKPL